MNSEGMKKYSGKDKKDGDFQYKWQSRGTVIRSWGIKTEKEK